MLTHDEIPIIRSILYILLIVLIIGGAALTWIEYELKDIEKKDDNEEEKI